MKERIEAEMKTLNELVGQINDGKNQIATMEKNALVLQGRIMMLQELEKEEKGTEEEASSE
jgi:hypothetical protein